MNDEEIAQYNQLCDDWRSYNSIIWQIPAASGAVMAIFLASAYEYIDTFFTRALVLMLGSLLLLALTIALYKHRFFHDARTAKIKAIEEKWTKEKRIASPAQRETKKYSALIPDDLIVKPQKIWESQSAVSWLKFSMWVMTCVIFLLGIWNLFLSLDC